MFCYFAWHELCNKVILNKEILNKENKGSTLPEEGIPRRNDLFTSSLLFQFLHHQFVF